MFQNFYLYICCYFFEKEAFRLRYHIFQGSGATVAHRKTEDIFFKFIIVSHSEPEIKSDKFFMFINFYFDICCYFL